MSDFVTMRRHSRTSSNASLSNTKSEAASSERSTRSRTTSDDLMVLEFPKMTRIRRKSGVEPLKNGQGTSTTASSEGDGSRRGTRSGQEKAIFVDNAMESSTEHLGASGDTKGSSSDHSRRRSGRLVSTGEEAAKPQLPNTQKEGRSLRKRNRSSTLAEHVDQSSGETTKENHMDGSSQADILNCNVSSNKHRFEDSDAKSVLEATSMEHANPDDLTKSTSGEMDPCAESASATSSRRIESHKSKDKTARLELLSAGSSEATGHRMSPRRAKQLQQPHAASSSNSQREDEEQPVEADGDESLCLAHNGVGRSEKSTPRKRTRSISTSISPRKSLDNETTATAGQAAPSSPKRRRSGIVCRDLSQDFDTITQVTTATGTQPALDSSQAVCNNEVTTTDCYSGSSGVLISESCSVSKPDVDNETSKGDVVHQSATESVARSRRKSGTSSRGTPLKLDLTRSPTRRGLRSSGTVLTDGVSSSSWDVPAVETSVSADRGEATPSLPSPAASPRRSSGKRKKSSKRDMAREVGEVGEGPIPGANISREEVNYQAEEWYEDIDESEPFYFESDHMAIKGNKDYRMLLRTLTTLEAQRKQATQDVDRLLECCDKALRNPIKFVHKLQHKETVNLPNSQRVVTLPEINWQRYIGPPETNELLGLVSEPRSMRPSKSASTSGQSKPVAIAPSETLTAGVPVSADFQNIPSTSSSPALDSGGVQVAENVETKTQSKVEVVRGRVMGEAKPLTFNQLWTRDEQRKLEELLVKHPMEDVEARRWEKIARELKNRTSQQVASRVQKYFVKLTKAGMPVPGRLPNMPVYQTTRKGGKKMHPFTKPLYQTSTFLQSIQPPVYMSEDDPYAYTTQSLDDADDDDLISDDESIPVTLRDTAEYQELIKLKLLKKRRTQQQGHVGYSCDGCNTEPIMGVRWHCAECPELLSTDLCQRCVDCHFSSKHHSSRHRMEPVQTGYSQSYVDGDYTSFEPSSGDYNYLDPNYNPMQAT